MERSNAMLVGLTIRQWTATKHDKNVSAEVEQTHTAHNAGRYNKRLIDKAHLAPINQIASQLREYHYSRTLAWSDQGERMLPAELFMEYRDEMAARKQKFQTAVADFVRLYPDLVTEARTRLNTMFRPLDYPPAADLFGMFGIETVFMPIPNAQDFRIALSQEAQEALREQITTSILDRQKAAVSDCWARIYEVVERIYAQCSKEKTVIRTSLMDNASELASLLGALNISNDPGLNEAEEIIRKLIMPVDRLRESLSLRLAVASDAARLLEKIPRE